MYKNNFVAVIKVNGNILREQNEEVKIPFNSEYSIFLKNLNSVKSQVKISIDGENVTNGWIILNANTDLDLQRYIKNLNSGNKFKFIERSKNIENYRGIKAEDSLIQIEYKFEQKNYWNYSYITEPYLQTITQTTPLIFPTYTTIGNICQSTEENIGQIFGGFNTNNIMCMSCSTIPVSNDQGITVPGSQSNQQFYNTYDFPCEASQMIVLKLSGYYENQKIEKPITVNFKPKCFTCGKLNKITNKYCSECGTSLIIF